MYGAPGAAAWHKGPATRLQTAALPKCLSSLQLRTSSETGISHSSSSTECCERICLPSSLPGPYGVISGTQSSVLGCSSLRKHAALVPALLTRRSLGRKVRSIRESSFTEATSDETTESRPEVVRRVTAATDAGPVEGEGVQIEVCLLSSIFVCSFVALNQICFRGFF